ncbi:MAG: hydrogenase maturation nickel metallochaperone HypA [Gemmatimonadota bacterium]|nr:MAG: hydrogenase maturation nickel metallochaperone HypA [Gemmatimonadota bacterium]
MHEMALALEIGAICDRELAKLPETRVTAVGVEVGAFSGVEVDSLQFCLEVVLSERFAGVRCEIAREAGTAACPVCGLEFEVMRAPFECPECGVMARGVSGGQGLQLTYLEVE